MWGVVKMLLRGPCQPDYFVSDVFTCWFSISLDVSNQVMYRLSVGTTCNENRIINKGISALAGGTICLSICREIICYLFKLYECFLLMCYKMYKGLQLHQFWRIVIVWQRNCSKLFIEYALFSVLLENLSISLRCLFGTFLNQAEKVHEVSPRFMKFDEKILQNFIKFHEFS